MKPKRKTRKTYKTHRRRNISIGVCLLLLAALALAPTIDWKFPFSSWRQVMNSRPITFPLLTPPDDTLRRHIIKTLTYIYRNINPETYQSYSFPGDKRLRYWSVIYDDSMRCIAHIRTGDIVMAQRTLDYYIDNKAIQKIGWINKNGKNVPRNGWNVNIIDAAEARAGGRGIEHIAHTGPNAYLGIASLHLYHATKIPKYLRFARSRWLLIKDLQNEDPNDPNYGGVRMGPMGDPGNPQEQRLNFIQTNPSFYEFYNGEHAADFKALSDLLARLDPTNQTKYRYASHLISIWDHKIYDSRNHLFFIGTSEKKYFDDNIEKWVGPGVVAIHPLDTSALKICTYGVEGLEQFEPGAAEKIREAIENGFKVAMDTNLRTQTTHVEGYDFIAQDLRKDIILYEEEGVNGDYKVKKGRGRIPLLSDEWSTWVAFADLRMAKDFRAMGEYEKSEHYLTLYKQNALVEGLKTADPLDEYTLAYPYVHPMTYGFNKPVGFGWNTHHQPYSIIGGVARILGIMGADPFNIDNEVLSINVTAHKFRLAPRLTLPPTGGLVTEAELYVNKAWEHVREAQKRGPYEAVEWEAAIDVIDRMLSEHPDWEVIAANQNKMAAQSGDQFPLKGISNINIPDLEPIYRKYWALYHIGTGQFIRVMSYSELAVISKSQNDKKAQWENEVKARRAAEQIVKNYFYAQSFDKTGWLWQPVLSLREYIEGYDVRI